MLSEQLKRDPLAKAFAIGSKHGEEQRKPWLRKLCLGFVFLGAALEAQLLLDGARFVAQHAVSVRRTVPSHVATSSHGPPEVFPPPSFCSGRCHTQKWSLSGSQEWPEFECPKKGPSCPAPENGPRTAPAHGSTLVLRWQVLGLLVVSSVGALDLSEALSPRSASAGDWGKDPMPCSAPQGGPGGVARGDR